MEGLLDLQRAAVLTCPTGTPKITPGLLSRRRGTLGMGGETCSVCRGKTLLVRSTLLVSVLQPRLLQVPHRAAISLYAANPLLLQIIRLLLFQPNFFSKS